MARGGQSGGHSTGRALRLHRRALRLERGHQLDEALACQLEATSAAPRMPLMHLELGRFLMRRGEFRPGLTEFERHWRLKGRVNGVPRLPISAWNGMRLPRGRILLVADQGAGDAIQFARYIPLVAERCREVVLAAAPELADLLRSAKGLTRVVTRYEHIGSVDVFCILSSLPFLLGTTLETIPAIAPYLTVDAARRAAWKARLDARTPPGLPRVGIAWAGNPTHPDDRRRSTRLAAWQPLLDVPGVSFISLQKRVPKRDRGFMASARRVIDLTDGRDDFADTAALVQALDLVVSVDTSIAHIAALSPNAHGYPRPVTRLAVAPRPRGQSLVSDAPAIPPGRAGSVGRASPTCRRKVTCRSCGRPEGVVNARLRRLEASFITSPH